MIARKNIILIHIAYWLVIYIIDISRVISYIFDMALLKLLLAELFIKIGVIYLNIYLIESIKKVKFKIVIIVFIVFVCAIIFAFATIFSRQFLIIPTSIFEVTVSMDFQIDFIFNRAFSYISNLILFLGMYHTIKYMNSISKYKDLEIANQENAISSLKNQLNPHFLMNTLNNIYGSVIEKAPEGGEMILQLSGLLRKSYAFIKKPLITIEEEIDYLKKYIDLEKIRFFQKLSIEFNTQVDDFQKKIPPMILICYIENAFKHGLSELTSKGYLNIDIVLIENNFHFCIENSKPALLIKKDSYGSGISNTKKILDIMYKDKYKFIIDEELNMYRLTLSIFL